MLAKFSTSLRKRPLWPTLERFLASSADYAEIHPHDFEFAVDPRGNSRRQLYVLLLTPLSLEETERNETVDRISRFSTLANEHDDILIALLHQADGDCITAASHVGKEDCRPLLLLQKLLVERLDGPLIPILSIPSPASLLPCLEAHIKQLSSIPASLEANVPRISPYLLSQTTVSAPERPLDRHTTHVLSDLFPSFGALSRGVQTREGKELLREYFDREIVEGMERFWGVEEDEQV
ncbi:hypothetical protein VTO42DRAFT_4883 [Malbranchea cinnamomea]